MQITYILCTVVQYYLHTEFTCCIVIRNDVSCHDTQAAPQRSEAGTISSEPEIVIFPVEFQSRAAADTQDALVVRSTLACIETATRNYLVVAVDNETFPMHARK